MKIASATPNKILYGISNRMDFYEFHAAYAVRQDFGLWRFYSSRSSAEDAIDDMKYQREQRLKRQHEQCRPDMF